MTERELVVELDKDPFEPIRLHMVSGKTLDILLPDAAHPLTNNALLIIKNQTVGARRAEGYDVISYQNIERVERLDLGKRQVNGGRKSGPRRR